MKTLWERLDPWFIPVAAVTRFFAPADITAINCVAVGGGLLCFSVSDDETPQKK